MTLSSPRPCHTDLVSPLSQTGRHDLLNAYQRNQPTSAQPNRMTLRQWRQSVPAGDEAFQAPSKRNDERLKPVR